MTHNPIIVALDFESASESRELVDTLGDSVDFYKIGMELYASAGMDFARELIGRGKQVFLDLKMYDIGETVRRAVKQVARTSVDFLTVHGSNAVMRAAVEGRGDSPLKLLGVTVLTSFDRQDLADLGYPCNVQDLVVLRVKNASAAGVDGIVCSPLEAAMVRATAGPRAIIVTPGVRSRTAESGDQKRIATPEEAIASGADYVVMGRQIIRSADPAAEAIRIRASLRESLLVARDGIEPPAFEL